VAGFEVITEAMAGVQGGLLWSNLLTLYEYMEPVCRAAIRSPQMAREPGLAKNGTDSVFCGHFI
jgi:hypothetical protein